MVSLKKTPKKLIAVLLAILMLITVIPAGLFTTVFAATNNCLAVEVDSVKVYFYGAETLEVEGNKVTYTGGDETVSAICVNGSEEVDTTDVITDGRCVQFTNDWLSNQNGWIAIICDNSIEKPTSEPNIDVDKSLPVITEDDITGVPADWTKDNATITVNATDNGTGVVAYSLDMETWKTENTFQISANGTYTFYAKDAVGNISVGTSITVDKIDKISPTFTVSVDPKTWTKESVTITVVATDSAGELDEKAYKFDNAEWTNNNKLVVNDNLTHKIAVRDKAGNVTKDEFAADKYDNEKPSIKNVQLQTSVTGSAWADIDYSKDYTSNNAKYRVAITADDNEKSGVKGYYISNEIINDFENIEFNSESVIPVEAGSEFYVYAIDNAGNVSNEYFVSLLEDNDAPVVNHTQSPAANEPTNKSVVFTITAEDLSGVKEYGVSNNKMTGIEALESDDIKWQKGNAFEFKDCDKHYIYVKDNTNANINDGYEIQALNYNNIAPAKPAVSSDNNEWTNETVTVTVTAEPSVNDAGVSFEIVEYAKDGEWQDNNTFKIEDAKKHKYQVKDSAGNISAEYEFAVDNYDAVKPTLVNGHAITFDQNNDGWFASLLNELTRGRFFNERLVIKVSAQDIPDETSNVSGIASAEFEFVSLDGESYIFDATKKIESINENTISFTVEKDELPKDFKGYANVILKDATKETGNINTIKVTTDNSNIAAVDGDFDFMIENNAPTVDRVTPSETPVKNIYKEDYSVNYEFSDKAGVNNSGIAIVKLDVNGTTVLCEEYQPSEKLDGQISVTTNAEKETLNGIKIENWNKGELTYSISVVDYAGNVSEPNEVTYYFDQTAPEITGFEFSKADDGYYKDENPFDKAYEAVTTIDYGFYFKNTVEVTVSAEDESYTEKEAISTGVKSITVYLKDVDNNKLYTVKANGDEITEISSLEEIATVETNDKLSFVVPKDFKGQIYAYATDNVDNSPKSCRYITDNDVKDGYVSPDGSIIETTDKHKDTSEIIFKRIPKAKGTQNTSSVFSYDTKNVQPDETLDYVKNVGDNKVPIYNSDISFGVEVTDTYSGIREVSYTIIEGPETRVKTVQIDNSGNFVDGKDEGWTIDEETKDSNLVTKMTNNIEVTGNYNDMVLLIELTDRAGNKSYDYYVLGIDKTAPSIDVEYDNNAGDSQSGTGTYFKANRTATITVSERNFNKENVKFTVKNAEGAAPSVKFVKDVKGTGNGDDTKHVFEVTYSNNGVYSFDMNYTDRATNKNTDIDYKDSLAPEKFVVDKTNPTISVSYDNNEAQNDKFFKANRTATITIVEHNFDVNRVVITQTSALSGNAISNPSVSWVNNGDTHTGTINYNNDGDYTFDITMTDKAGNKEDAVNYGSSVAAKDFTVDTAYSDIVKVDGIEDKGVLDENEKINITINDVNLDNYNIVLTRSRVLVSGESNEVDKEKLDKSSVVNNPENQMENGKVFYTSDGSENTTVTIDIPKRDKDGVKNDGLYTLTIEAKDKAGNAYDSNANVITFSVNRFGSVFTFSQDLYDLVTNNDGYTKYSEIADKSIAVYEYNSTAVKNQKVELIANNDSKFLTENSGYTVARDAQQTNTTWNQYTYNIKPENFEKDGVYTLRVSSTDRSSINSQTANYDLCSANFVVDNTTPSISSINYSVEVNKVPMNDEWGSAKTDNLKVTFTVEDLMRLKTIEVKINGKTENVYTYGKDGFDDENSFSEEFTLPVGDNSFEIIATDKVNNTMSTSKGGSDGSNFEHGYVFFDHITVTTNQLVIWAKSPLFWGIIGGTAAIAVGIVIFIIVKKRKKNDDDNKQTPQES